jgi:hypothetical protein
LRLGLDRLGRGEDSRIFDTSCSGVCGALWACASAENVLKLVWPREDEFDFQGRFFETTRGFHQPKPIQRPHVVADAVGARVLRLPLGQRVLAALRQSQSMNSPVRARKP